MNYPQPKTAKEKQFETLFQEFVSMGDQRSYGKLARKHGLEAPELMRHARAFMWPERVHALLIRTNEQTATADDPLEAASAEINRLHLTRLKLLQKKAMDFLENVVFDRPDTALKMLIESMKLEREIKGMNKEKTDDLRSVLEKRLKESSEQKSTEPEFVYDPNFQIEELDGPQESSPPPSGGDHAQ